MLVTRQLGGAKATDGEERTREKSFVEGGRVRLALYFRPYGSLRCEREPHFQLAV